MQGKQDKQRPQRNMTFIEKINQLEKEASAYIETIVTEQPIVLFDPEEEDEDEDEDEEEPEERDYLPEYQDFDAYTSNLYANVCKVWRNKVGTVMIEGIMREDDSQSLVPLSNLDAYACCSLADYLAHLETERKNSLIPSVKYLDEREVKAKQ